MQLSWFYRAFLQELHVRQIRYLLVGGFAVRYYGYLRETRDLDIWTAANQADAVQVCALCRELFDLPDLPVEPFAEENRIIHLTRAPSQAEIRVPRLGAQPESLSQISGSSATVEILTVQSGLSFESCYPERVSASVDGAPASIIRLAHLKTAKGVMPPRSKDLDDLAHLP